MTLHRDRIVIVSGLSGSGKSTALKILEDFGYFCVDNLPVILLPKFVELFLQSSGEITKVALVMDLREPEFLRQYPAVFKQIQELGYHLKIIFLEADPEVLLRRFNETRRKHPLAMEDEPLRESIERERGQLQELKQWARIVIDTSNDTVHDLKRKISDLFRVEEKRSLLISLLSFGFSNGIPTEADLVFDVRFLPNPYFVEELRSKSGNEPEVQRWIFQHEVTRDFLAKLDDLLLFLLPLYEREGKAYLTIAIGCTGGMHRSVTIVNELGKRFSEAGYRIRIHHRDLYRASPGEKG